jgi:DNA recombination protein RmuC
MDQKIREIREQNAEKLEDMRKTVDEKLQKSVEHHFNESFKMIGERLEMVQKGLGEMQALASGVGDLKKVLSNVKTRGNIGEIQLSVILEQYLAPDQFLVNAVTVPGSRELVEFAIKLPGKKDDVPVLLPVDSKFPVEDYQRLLEGYETYPKTSPELKKIQTAFERAVRNSAKMIRDKYIHPPETTDFALMFVPSEGIYAEILRLPGLVETLQNELHISVAGPSNLVAFLNSLQMGFRTLAIEKRSHEVWNVLSAVKTEFKKFGEEVDSTRKSLQTAMNHMEKLGTRSRALERELREVQELPAEKSGISVENPLHLEGDEI